MKKCMHKIENMPLQPFSIYSCPWQMSRSAFFSSKTFCVGCILIGNRVRVKSLGMAPGLANARPTGSEKFANAPPPGPFPSFQTRTRSYQKEIGSSVKDRNKLKRVVKVCSRFYACISSLLIKPKLLHSEIGAIDVNQRFLVIESNFCWHYLKNILSYCFIKLFMTYKFTALY